MDKRVLIAFGMIVGIIAVCALVIGLPLVVGYGLPRQPNYEKTTYNYNNISQTTNNYDQISQITNINDKISQTIVDNAEFPNGTYIVSLSNYLSAPATWIPTIPNDTVLQKLGLVIDKTNNVLVTNRKTFLYVLLPPKTTVGRRRRRDFEAITAIGIKFDGSEKLHVIPLSLQTSNQGFIKRGTSPDGSELFQIPITAPQTMCSVASGTQCSSVSWSSYALGTIMASPASNPSILSAACGSQCDFNGGTCQKSCEQCNGESVSGADTPISRYFTMGKSIGSFDFKYQTYSVPDRIRIFQADEQIFNTGCLGTQVFVAKSIVLNGKSNEIRVDVEPNCDGTTGTVWVFEIGCPSPCDVNSDKQIKVMNGLYEITAGTTVFINENAEMPLIAATYCSIDTTITVSWNFKLTKSGMNDDVCVDDITLTGYGQQWEITKNIRQVIGGKAQLSWTADGVSGSVSFNIVGKQPDRLTVMQYISSSTNLWYAPYIALHESTQGSILGPTQFSTKNIGYPLKSSDNGYGVMQLTNPPPSCMQIWSWKANCDEGLRRLRVLAQNAQSWMTSQRSQALGDVGNEVPVPDHAEAKCIFKDNSPRTIEDAVAMKMFNGASEGNFCAWQNNIKQWKFNVLNNLGFNYVERVCQNVPTS